MPQAYVVDGVRTPVGRHNGSLRGVRPDDLAAHVVRALLERQPALPPDAVEDVILGAANQAGEDNRNLARMAALLAGLPDSVPGVTVNRLCASGLTAVAMAAQAIIAGEADVIVAGGAESMTRAPLVLDKGESGFVRGDRVAYDTTLGWRFPNPRLAERFPLESMAETAENVAERFAIGREAQDAFALRSQQRWLAARERGEFDAEIVPVPVADGKSVRRFAEDEHPRPDTTLESLARLRPIVRPDGTVTAGNASGINDGAAALLLVSERAVERYALAPLARVLGGSQVGVDPRFMGIGPVPATRRLATRLGVTPAAFDSVELNEAFAAQSLACIAELGLDPARVNPQGGAIAIGHPLGMSGARLVVTLAHRMRRERLDLGLATLCVGVGQGVALALRRV
jgi:3-oxoadipyl-CoA thiolase